MAEELQATYLNLDASNPQFVKLLRQKKSARDFRDRRRLDWDDNYELYRNIVKTNRLTQRQVVNIPLMKETIKTILSKIDDPPNVEWKDLGGELRKEIVFQEIWNSEYDRLNLEGIDILDKKTVLLYGRSFKKLNPTDEGVDIRPLDIYDVIVDPLTDSINLETARFLIHQNIFRTAQDIISDERYDKEARNKVKQYLGSREGLLQTGYNRIEYERKLERLKVLRQGGTEGVEIPVFTAGETLLNISEHYVREWDEKLNKFEKKVYVYSDDRVLLMQEKLKDLIGVEFYPFVTWGDDIESNDFWSDGIADLVRTPNKILNIWFSQLVENRTLRNFQMHWYDATQQGYTPQTYEPGPGRMLPAPGDPNKTVMPVDISGLDETLTAIQFLTSVVERATATSAIEKGIQQPKGKGTGGGKTTLGEIRLVLGKAMERTVYMAKFYRRGWKELCMKWYQILNANPKSKFKLFKSSRDGTIWPKTVIPKDWKSEAGYKPIVRSSSEQEEEKSKSIQKFQMVLQMFPDNPALLRIAQKRTIEILNLTPEEIKEIEDAEKQKIQQQLQQTAQEAIPQTTPQTQSQIQPAQFQTPQQSSPQVPNFEQQLLLNQIQKQLSGL